MISAKKFGVGNGRQRERTARVLVGSEKKRKTISFNLPYPPTVNRYWRQVGGRTLLSKRGRQYRNLAMEELLDQGVAGMRISDHVAVRIEVYVPDWRRRDLDNLPKGVLDALTHARVWGDDHQVDELRLIRMPGVMKGGMLAVTIAEASNCECFLPRPQQRKRSPPSRSGRRTAGMSLEHALDLIEPGTEPYCFQVAQVAQPAMTRADGVPPPPELGGTGGTRRGKYRDIVRHLASPVDN